MNEILDYYGIIDEEVHDEFELDSASENIEFSLEELSNDQNKDKR